MVLACLLLAGALLGYSWTGTQIRMYDDSDATGGHTAGQPHSAAEMAASTDPNVAANWLLDVGTGPMASYRGLASVIEGSSTGGTATTTWTDSNAIFRWDNTKGLSQAGTNNFINWGTKVGSGNTATGRNGIVASFGTALSLSGRLKFYACDFVSSSSIAIQGDTSSEYIDCIMGSTATGVTGRVNIGTSGVTTGVVYNLDLWSNGAGATSGVCQSFNSTACERITIGGGANAAAFRLAGGLVQAKDIRIFGTPTTSDIVWTVSPTLGSFFVRPVWSGAPRMTGNTVAVGNFYEAWIFDTHVVDGSGNPVSGVAVTLTDVLGNVPVNTVTDSDGRISFGSGLLQNAVPVVDHVVTAGVYSTRTRSPFLLDVGGGKRRIRFTWPGEPTQTYSDVVMPVPWEFASGGSTTWVEMSI